MELLNHLKRLTALVMAFGFGGLSFAQSLIPTPFTYSSCSFGVPPVGYVNCVGSPDCAASRCTVPSGCSGQSAMVFGESFSYVLPTPLVVGQTYDIQMFVSTGHLGASSIISGNHTFQIVGSTTVPPTCGSSSYGSICNLAGGQVLLTGTVTTIGWVLFTNSFVATMPISRITFTNCDGTGNGGNIFCSPSLTVGVPLAPISVEEFGGQFYDCQVNLEWQLSGESSEVSRFDVYRTSADAQRTKIGSLGAADIYGKSHFRYTDLEPSTDGHYQLEVVSPEGRITQSPVIEVLGGCPEAGLAILSNPVVGDEATIRYNPQMGTATLKVYDLSGRMVYETQLSAGPEATREHSFPISDWKPGVYFLRLGEGEVVKMYVGR